MNIKNIIECDIQEVAGWAAKEFHSPLSNSIESVEEIRRIYQDMQILTNQYAYLASILAHFKFYVRAAKNDKNKKLADELIDKKEIIQRALDSVELKQSTLSRMITIKQEIDRELQMNRIG